MNLAFQRGQLNPLIAIKRPINATKNCASFDSWGIELD